MNEVVMLRGPEPRKILQTAIEKEIPAIMSYLSKGKWHVAKVVLTDLGATRFDVNVSPRRKPHPINIRVDQPVGISFKYDYGKFIFETMVVGLTPSAEPADGGTIALAIPDRMELVQRRSYFRVEVPKTLRVKVTLWHRSSTETDHPEPPEHYWECRLTDISAGGAQIAIDSAQAQNFKKGQYITLRFTPVPYELPLMFNAQIRSVLPTADGKDVCFGLQIVGLEASPEGRRVLARLVEIVERYYQINQSGVRQQEMQGIEPQPVGS